GEREAAAEGLGCAAATGRRRVKAEGLYTGREAPAVGLQPLSGVEAQSIALESGGDAASSYGTFSYNAPYARDLTFMAFPSGATLPTPATPARTASTTTPSTTTG